MDENIILGTLELSIDNGESTSFEWSISKESLVVLEEFIVVSHELLNTSFFLAVNNYSSSFSIRNGATSFSSTQIDPDVLGNYLLLIRPIILQNEPTFFYKILGIVNKSIKNKIMNSLLIDIKKYFDGTHARSIFDIESNGISMFSDKYLNNWLNGFKYHRDIDKQAFIRSLHKIMPLSEAEPYVVTNLKYKGEAIRRLFLIIDPLVGNKRRSNFSYRIS